MRAASASMISFLQARLPFSSADLFTLTLLDGTQYGYTSSDQSISHGSQVWYAVGPSITRTSWSVKNTTDIPEMSLKIFSTGADFGLGNFKLLCHNGLLDGASFLLQRAIMPTYGDTSLGLVTLFSGGVSSVKVTAIGVEVTVKGANLALQQYMPRNQYQVNCIHALYDSGCTIVRSTRQETHALTVSNDGQTVQIAAFVSPASYFVGGTIKMTSGVAAGQLRTIQAASGLQINVAYPFYEVPAVGDTAVITQGCNKAQTTCSAQFSNLQNFRGFPYVPPAETGL